MCFKLSHRLRFGSVLGHVIFWNLKKKSKSPGFLRGQPQMELTWLDARITAKFEGSYLGDPGVWNSAIADFSLKVLIFLKSEIQRSRKPGNRILYITYIHIEYALPSERVVVAARRLFVYTVHCHRRRHRFASRLLGWASASYLAFCSALVGSKFFDTSSSCMPWHGPESLCWFVSVFHTVSGPFDF